MVDRKAGGVSGGVSGLVSGGVSGGVSEGVIPVHDKFDSISTFFNKEKNETEEQKRDKKWMQEFQWAEDQLAEVKETFSFFDKNGDGVIPHDMFGDAIRALGQCPSNAVIDELITTVHFNDNGTISLDEFVKAVGAYGLKDDLELQEQLEEALKVFACDEQGSIDADTLRKALKEHGEPLDDEDITEMIQLAGVDQDNKVNYFDMVRHVCTLK